MAVIVVSGGILSCLQNNKSPEELLVFQSRGFELDLPA